MLYLHDKESRLKPFLTELHSVYVLMTSTTHLFVCKCLFGFTLAVLILNGYLSHHCLLLTSIGDRWGLSSAHVHINQAPSLFYWLNWCYQSVQLFLLKLGVTHRCLTCLDSAGLILSTRKDVSFSSSCNAFALSVSLSLSCKHTWPLAEQIWDIYGLKYDKYSYEKGPEKNCRRAL